VPNYLLMTLIRISITRGVTGSHQGFGAPQKDCIALSFVGI
jgi:hypothetical protein